MYWKFLLQLIALCFAAQAYAAPVNLTGAETGGTTAVDLDVRSVNGTFSISTTTVRTGTYSWRTNPSGKATGNIRISGINANGSSSSSVEISKATVYSRFYVNIAALPLSGTEEELAEIVDTAGTYKSHIRITGSGNLKWCDSTASCTSAGTTALTTGTWYRLEWMAGTGASAAYEVKIDGVSELSGTGSSGTGNVGSLRLGKTTDRSANASQTYDMYFDDILIDDAAYPGAGAIKLMLVDSDGSSVGWTGGTGTTSTELDETPSDSDTTYVKTTVAATQLVGFESAASAGISGTINAVKAFAVVRDEGGAPTVSARIRMNATNTDTTAVDPGASYVARYKLISVDPSDSLAITTTDLDTVEAGCTTGTAVALRCSTVGMMVDFQPAVATATPTAAPTSTPTPTPTATPTPTPTSVPLRLLSSTGVGQ